MREGQKGQKDPLGEKEKYQNLRPPGTEAWDPPLLCFVSRQWNCCGKPAKKSKKKNVKIDVRSYVDRRIIGAVSTKPGERQKKAS